MYVCTVVIPYYVLIQNFMTTSENANSHLPQDAPNHTSNDNLMMLLLTHSDQYGSDTDLLLAAGNIGRAMAGFVNTVDGLVHYNVCSYIY